MLDYNLELLDAKVRHADGPETGIASCLVSNDRKPSMRGYFTYLALPCARAASISDHVLRISGAN